MFDFRLIGKNAAGLQAGIAIATSRAGGLGVLDLAGGGDGADTARALGELETYGRGRCGIRLSDVLGEIPWSVLDPMPGRVGTLVLETESEETLARCAGICAEHDLELLVEATCLEEARRAREAGADGIIAKGHEAGGRVGEETALILLQRLVRSLDVPIYVQGGISPHTAAACSVGGAAGVVLDWQLALTRESALPQWLRDAIARFEGSESLCVGGDLRDTFRVLAPPGSAIVAAVTSLEAGLVEDGAGAEEKRTAWRRGLGRQRRASGGEESLVFVGQEACMAAPLADLHKTVGGVLKAFGDAVVSHRRDAARLRPLAAGSTLAEFQGTRFPIAQGPMTRVSDKPEFALEVAKAGGLPFMALSVMREDKVRSLLEETRELLGDRPWGVGILGFVPLELRLEQLKVIRQVRPRFALIAGGRPDQARQLEEDGISTYLHVPSPGLLELFLSQGSRRFVFEGRECGGHVGPRSSFVLWSTMIDLLCRELPESEAAECQVLFAGGVHDALSSAMVATMAAPLARRGIGVGVLMGTGYLFTEEAVATGAILPGFQEAAIACERTVLLESGPGHATRSADSEFSDTFMKMRRDLLSQGVPAEEIRERLEELNLGRLRIASKGVERVEDEGGDGEPRYVDVDEEEQRSKGLYMIGELAALRDRRCTIEELHRGVSEHGSALLEPVPTQEAPVSAVARAARPSDVAIIGMSCLLPKAQDVRSYWSNILNKVDAITEVPRDRWDWNDYFDPDKGVRDKIYSKWGGFLDDIVFDPLKYGMPPNSISSIEPLQLLTLEVARAAMDDAGYLDRPFDRERASVILGAGGGVSDLGVAYSFRSSLPAMMVESSPELLDRLPEWTEDSFPGILMNVAAGRVANRLDLGGLNCTMDAACAASLAALYLAVQELETGASDLVITGGADTAQNPFMYLCFAKTQALSPSGRCRTFDQQADGIAISEGVAALVLKRLADAERDGDRIYAVIKGVGGSSDGREKGLTAPRPAGQAKALRRAYGKAGFSPATVGLIEAHGTGTVAGDKAEVETLKTVFQAEGAETQTCALGSVKSMIGHTKCTAGVAGLIKVALALHHKVLPPTLHATEPNKEANFPESPFYVNTELRPWVQASPALPRRAGVSAFGFGGTNFHVAVEEYTDAVPVGVEPAVSDDWPADLFVFRGATPADLMEEIDLCRSVVEATETVPLADLSFSFWRRARDRREASRALSIVATSRTDLAAKLEAARSLLEGNDAGREARDVAYFEEALADGGEVAFLFPGQGSQYTHMLTELASYLSELRESFELADRVLANRLPRPLSRYILPPVAFTPEERRRQMAELTATRVAQPALGAAEVGLLRLLETLAVVPRFVAGHSYGEYVALHAGGVFDADTLLTLSELRGRCIEEEAEAGLGTMAAVASEPGRVLQELEGISDVWVANVNAPLQTVISGSDEGVAEAMRRLEEAGVNATKLNVACAFHSPLVAPAADRLGEALRNEVDFSQPVREVFSNTTAEPYPESPKDIARQLVAHLASPVRFADEVTAMYDRGARIFVEVGPRAVLSGLARKILADRDVAILTIDPPDRPGMASFLGVLGTLLAHGVDVDLERLYAGRASEPKDLHELSQTSGESAYPPAAWLVNGGRSRPAAGPAVQPTRTEGRKKPDAKPTVDPSVPAPSAAPAPAVMPVSGSPAGARAPEPETARQPLPAAGLTPPSAPDGDDVAQIVSQHQKLMRRFLETQQAVMQAFLEGDSTEVSPPPAEAPFEIDSAPGGDASEVTPPQAVEQVPERPPRPGASAETPAPATVETELATADLTSLLVSIVSDRTGYPPEMLKVDADVTSDLGIDSIKWVEILGAFQSACPPRLSDALQSRQEALVAARTLQEVGDLASGLLAGEDSEDAVAAGPVETAMRREDVLQLLVQVVSDRTGYPPEMLKVDADVTSDLGIDSIKWVEILGALQESAEEETRQRMGELMEPLTRARTLEETAALLTPTDGEPAPERREPPTAPAGALPTTPVVPSAAESRVPRFAVESVERALAGSSTPFSSELPLLVVEDEIGVGEQVEQLLAAREQPHVRVKYRPELAQLEDGAWGADLAQPDQIRQLVKSVREEHGPLGGILYLLPLAETSAAETDLDSRAWKLRLQAEVKGLFHLAQALASDLSAAGRNGAAAVVAATGMGGDFGLVAETSRPVFPGQAGVAGLVKTLAREWVDVRCKVVDLDLQQPVEDLAASILGELDGADPEVEVGYRGSRRSVLRPRSTADRPDAASPLDAESVVVITGGARGITAEIAKELAERYQPKLFLLGRSPLPPDVESPETADEDAEGDLKRILFEQLGASGEEVTPVILEAAFRRLMAEREIRANLAAIRATGAPVSYLRADVLDPASVRNAVEEVTAAHGRIDGLIHGAGVIEDKLLVDKTTDSFDRVFDTKVDGLLHLLELVPPTSLRLLVLFASVAGRFGNVGQCDYAAANEVLNRLATHVTRRCEARVVAVNWGPWQATGMASSEVQRRFAERGVQLIAAEGGREAFAEVLERGRDEEVEVLLGDGPWREPPPARDADVDIVLPLVAHRGANGGGNGHTKAVYTLDPDRDLYLHDHQLDGKPVLPAAMALEYIAEAVQKEWPDHHLLAVRDFQVLNGVVLAHGTSQISLATHAVQATSRDASRVEARVELSDAATERACYRAIVDLSTERPSPPSTRLDPSMDLDPFPMSVRSAYDSWLFHGPAFQTIEQIQGVTDNVIVGVLKSSSPRACISEAPSSHWLIDPVVVDGAFQLTLLFARLKTDMTPLPARFGILRLYSDLGGSDVRCVIRARFGAGGQHLQTHTSFQNGDGELIAVLEDAEFTSSPALNRLGGQWRRPSAS